MPGKKHFCKRTSRTYFKPYNRSISHSGLGQSLSYSLPFQLWGNYGMKDIQNSVLFIILQIGDLSRFKYFETVYFLVMYNCEGGNLAASKIRNLECPSYEICLIDYGCGKFNRKIHIMEQYP